MGGGSFVHLSIHSANLLWVLFQQGLREAQGVGGLPSHPRGMEGGLSGHTEPQPQLKACRLWVFSGPCAVGADPGERGATTASGKPRGSQGLGSLALQKCLNSGP